MKRIRSLAPALGLMALILAVAMGLFCGIWGWERFKLDFWPLDTSRVGPNLCASLVLVVLLIAHNEFVVMRRSEKMHENHRQATEDVLRELLHPTDEAEADIAAQVEEKWRQQVLDGLDEKTPGGVGAVLARLETAPKPPAKPPAVRKATVKKENPTKR